MDTQEPNPPSPQLQLTQGSELRLTDGTHDLKIHKAREILYLQVQRQDRNLLSIAVSPDSEIHQIFNAATHGTTGHTIALENREGTKTPEYPPITVEGFTGRQGTYRQSDIRRDEMEYYVYLYYRPAPDEDWKFTIPYHVHFFGDQAEKLKAEKITGGARLRVSGELHTKTVTGKGGVKKEQYDIYAQGYEFFKGKPKPMPDETRRPS